MELKTWTILFLVVAAQGLLVGSLLLFRKKMWNSAGIHLSVLIFSFSITLSLWVGFWNNWNYVFPSLSFIHISVPLLFGPSIYLHLRTLDRPTRKLDLLHYLPFVIGLLYFAPYFLASEESRVLYIFENQHNPDIVSSSATYLQVFSLILYTSLLHRLPVNDSKKLNWTIIIKRYFLLFTCVFVGCSFFFHFVLYNLYIDVIGAMIMVFSIYSIGFMSFNRLSIFHRLDLSNANKYNKSALTEKYAEIIFDKLHVFLTRDKAYKSSTMTLSKVSKLIEIPPHYISESLNKYKGTSFSDFINHLRVEEAKELLLSPAYSTFKVESIGYAVGFNSKTTFYNAFKKKTGKSPANYQKAILEVA